MTRRISPPIRRMPTISRTIEPCRRHRHDGKCRADGNRQGGQLNSGSGNSESGGGVNSSAGTYQTSDSTSGSLPMLSQVPLAGYR
jgi:hypothetical protein